MTKYIVTIDSRPDDYAVVYSRDRITAALDALGIKIYSEQEWEDVGSPDLREVWNLSDPTP